MRAAPPVRLRSGGGRLWRAVRVLLPASATAAASVWGLAHLEAPIGLATIPVGLVAALAFRATRAPVVEWCWDGRQWSADGVAGRIEVRMDLQRWMLLRLVPDAGGAPCWGAIAQEEAGATWPALRAALYARAPAAPAGP